MKILSAAALFLFAANSLAGIELKGPKTQGGMLIGKTEPGNKVFLNDKPLMVSKDGDFVFGFGRNEKLNHVLKIEGKDGKVEKESIVLTKRSYKVEKIEGIKSEYVSPPQEVIDRIISDREQVSKARAQITNRLDFLGEIQMPAQGRISGVYGSQRILNGQPKNPHYGLDIAAPTGTKVKSPLNGKVVLVHNDMYYTGGTLIVEHGHGVTSTFIHLSKILVKEGDMIKQGDDIAEIGATGRVTGPHLDWRMNWRNVRLDPQLLVK